MCPYDVVFRRRQLYISGSSTDLLRVLAPIPGPGSTPVPGPIFWGESLKAFFWRGADGSLIVEVASAKVAVIVLAPIGNVDRVWYKYPPIRKPN